MTEALLEELLEKPDKSLRTAHGHVTCIPGAVWLIAFRPADPLGAPLSWRMPDAKAAGRLVSALISPDMNLMIACMRDLWQGPNVVDDDYLVRLSELKRRDLVRQTRHGSRILPTPQGTELWRAAQEAVAREVLNKARRRGLGRPYFVVFDGASRPSAFKDWDRAVSYARHLVGRQPKAFEAVREPEDLVESWQSCMLSPVVLGEIERNGIAKFEE